MGLAGPTAVVRVGEGLPQGVGRPGRTAHVPRRLDLLRRVRVHSHAASRLVTLFGKSERYWCRRADRVFVLDPQTRPLPVSRDAGTSRECVDELTHLFLHETTGMYNQDPHALRPDGTKGLLYKNPIDCLLKTFKVSCDCWLRPGERTPPARCRRRTLADHSYPHVPRSSTG